MDNYPIDLSDCAKIGMWGGCGLTCPLYLEGDCEYHIEIAERLKTPEDIEQYRELYSE